MVHSSWYWSADLVEQLPLVGSVGAGLAFLLALCVRWWRREDVNLEHERERYDDALTEVKREHRAEMLVMREKTDRLERALATLLRASDDQEVRRAVTVALWPEGKPDGRRRSRNDGP